MDGRKKPQILKVLSYSVAAGIFLATLGIGFLVLHFGRFHFLMLLGVGPYVAVLTLGLASGGRWLRAVTALTWLHPLLLLASLYTTWLCGGLFLGHLPRPHYDDPKYISDWLAPPYLCTWLLLLTVPVGVIGGVILTVALAIQRGASAYATAGGLMGLAIWWTLAVLVLRSDPLNVLDWFMD